MSPREITSAVAQRHGLTHADLMRPRRFANIVKARQEAAWEMRQAGLSYGRIGAFFGQKGSTAIHGIRRHAKRIGARP